MDKFDAYYEIGELFAKYMKSELDDSEKKRLNDWIESSVDNRKLFEKMTQPEFLSEKLNVYGEIDRSESWNKIMDRLGYIEQPKKRYAYRYAKYAAIAIAVLLPLALLIYTGQKDNINTDSLVEVAQVIPPGKDRAILELADGRVIDLESATADEIASLGTGVVLKDSLGRLVYAFNKQHIKGDLKPYLAYNTIRTPRAGNYQLILPDGTAVFLNANTTLRFPTQFAESTRDVTLIGEAYFDVAKNINKPFHVHVNNTKVEVLGTQFNIAANDGKRVFTTLIEGAVEITAGNNKRKLVPGQQAVSTNDGLTVNKIDTYPVVAWKDGYFVLRNTSIYDLMASIAQWYDVEVVYSGNMDGVEFGGKFSKSTSLQELLKSLELTGTVKFKVEGRRVTAMR